MTGTWLGESRRIVRSWSGPTMLALFEQGTSAGANFAMQIVLARSLSSVEYGAFNVAYAVYLVMFSVPNYLLFEPMVVQGQRHAGPALDHYVGRLFRVHLGLSVLLAGGLAASAWFSPGGGVAVAEVSLRFALAAPALIAFQFLRRACYMRTAPGAAFGAGLAYAAVLLAGIWWWRDSLTGNLAALLLGASALAGSVVMITRQRWWSPLLRSPSPRDTTWSEVAACWNSGRWLLAAGLVGWVAGSSYLPLSALIAGLGAAGELRAAANLFQPVEHGLTALALLAGPWLARRRRERGEPFVRSRMWILGLLAAAAVAAWTLLMWQGGEVVVRLLYGQNSSYAGAVALIPLLGVAYAIRGLADVGLGAGLRALGNWRVALGSTTAGAVVMVAAGVPLIRAHGVTGILVSMALAGLAQLLVVARAALAPGPGSSREIR